MKILELLRSKVSNTYGVDPRSLLSYILPTKNLAKTQI